MAGTDAIIAGLDRDGVRGKAKVATSGCRPNIIDASFPALMISVIYKLGKSAPV